MAMSMQCGAIPSVVQPQASSSSRKCSSAAGLLQARNWQLSGQALKTAVPQKTDFVARSRGGGRVHCVSTEGVKSEASSSNLPLREIPGHYGGFLDAIRDRLDFFWFQGTQDFFKSRIEKHKSTVFRVNMPPGPPGFPDPRTIVLLDAKSFPVLFDMEKVEKKNVFTGTYMPSLDYTGGYRVLPYLDPQEERHTKLKQFCFEILRNNGKRFFPEFHNAISESFEIWESALRKGEEAAFQEQNYQFSFNFLMRSIVHRDPVAPGKASLGTEGPGHAVKWVIPQIIPISGAGLPHLVEELTIHNFPLPFALVKKDYEALFAFLDTYATDVVKTAAENGVERNDALNNILFFTCFNSFGGFAILFPLIINYLGQSGISLQKEVCEEVRAAVKNSGGNLSPKALEEMPLVKSIVYESLRINPPVPYQYGRAKKDFTIESHTSRFRVKKGEMLGGFQPFVTQDPVIFEDANTFIAKRFLGEEGEKLLSYVFWSNGRENEEPTLANKQCAGKDLVITVARLLIVELFLRYDSFTTGPLQGAGPVAKINFTKLNRATS